MLIIGTTGTETRFLSESELPEQARLNFSQPMSPKSQMSEDAQLAEALAKSQNDGKLMMEKGNESHDYRKDGLIIKTYDENSV